jgi:hypothetical protein
MKKTGTKNVSAIKEAIKNIQILTKFYNRKRLSKEEYISRVNKNLSNMANERDYIDYLRNIGQY